MKSNDIKVDRDFPPAKLVQKIRFFLKPDSRNRIYVKQLDKNDYCPT